MAAIRSTSRRLVVAGPVDGDFRVAYDRFAPEAPDGTERAFVRNVSPK